MKHNFRELKIWKEGIALTKSVYTLTYELPDSEKFGLKSQIQRCAGSIPSNIAEGSGRTSEKEFRHFLNISLGSAYELETQLVLINQIYDVTIDTVLKNLQELQKMIGGFKRLLTK
jgi:four helix bundle protein